MKKTLRHFEEAHGGSKIAEMEKQLEAERKKVEALAEVQNKISIEKSKDAHVRFGLIGCTHFGSLYHDGSGLDSFYKHLATEGINVCYHGGDVLDGHKVYRGQEFELRDVGLNNQLSRLSNFNSQGVKTRFITGNHDQVFKSLAGVAVGEDIEAAHEDFEFLGEEQAAVEFRTPNGPYKLMLIHPGGGSSYAISYKSQKIVESLEGGTKPNMLAIAHFHKAEFMPSYRNVAVIQTGTFQKQTPFMARQGLAAHVGGWVIDIWKGKDNNIIKSEFVAFY